MSGDSTHIAIAAYHEAGHAIAALSERRAVSLVAVSTDEPGNGICRCSRRRRNPYEVTFNKGTAKAAWLYTLATIRSDIRISLAGPLAEAKALGKPLRSLGARSDLVDCEVLANRMVVLNEYISQFAKVDCIAADKILNLERAHVRRWLAQPAIWRSVQIVTQALQKHKYINGAGLDTLVGIALNKTGQSQLRFGISPISRIGGLLRMNRSGFLGGYPASMKAPDC